MGNISVVMNYAGHGPYDSPGYIQFTRSAGRVFIVVDGRPVGSVPAREFSGIRKLLASEAPSAHAHKAHPQPGSVSDREDTPVTRGVLPAQFPLYGECRSCGEPVRCYDITADWGHDSEFEAPYRFAHPVTPAERFLMRQARAWIADCGFDLDDGDVGDLDNREVYGGVAAHYDGGWAAFMRAEFGAPGRYPAMAYVRDAGAVLVDTGLVPNAQAWVNLALSLPAGQDVWQG